MNKNKQVIKKILDHFSDLISDEEHSLFEYALVNECKDKLPHWLKSIVPTMTEYRDKYKRSIEANITTDNYANKSKVLSNAISTIKELAMEEYFDNDILMLPKAEDIKYMADYIVRRNYKVDCKDFRKTMSMIITGKDVKRVPQVSDEKDLEMDEYFYDLHSRQSNIEDEIPYRVFDNHSEEELIEQYRNYHEWRNNPLPDIILNADLNL